jgi:hypothetical protein
LHATNISLTYDLDFMRYYLNYQIGTNFIIFDKMVYDVRTPKDTYSVQHKFNESNLRSDIVFVKSLLILFYIRIFQHLLTYHLLSKVPTSMQQK